MRLLLPLLFVALFLVSPAHAYIGPGLGLGAIGAFFGAILAGLLAILGFFWYPIKRMRRKRKEQREAQAQTTTDDDQGA